MTLGNDYGKFINELDYGKYCNYSGKKKIVCVRKEKVFMFKLFRIYCVVYFYNLII